MNEQGTTDTTNFQDVEAAREFCEEVAGRARLREGPEGVRSLLRAVYVHRAHSLHELTEVTLLPLPVASAVRRELERCGIVERGSGIALTEAGRGCAARMFGRPIVDPSTELPGVPESFRAWARYWEGRPTVDTTLDQSHGTLDTAFRRAAYIRDHDGLIGRRVLVLGDDDLVCLALGALLGEEDGEVVVLELDERFVRYIRDIVGREHLHVRCLRHDLREPLPGELWDHFDVVATDPPYTLNGLGLFLSRAIDALRDARGRQAYLSFAHKSWDEMREIQASLSRMGWTIQEILLRFNQYHGASVLGSTSQMFRLIGTGALKSLVNGRYTESIYTGEGRRPSVYRCHGCRTRISIGPEAKIPTLEHLKENGCPECGGRKFVRVKKGKRS